MRIAIISDIHSNLESLQRVFATIDELEVDTIHCLGDIVGYGPFPAECIDLVRQRCTVILRGNHDSGIIDELDIDHFNEYGRIAIRWTKERVSPAEKEYIKNLPLTSVWEGLTLAHATPAEPSSWRYIMAWPEAREAFQAFSSDVCFIGHTHVPVIAGEDGTVDVFKKEKRYLINVGSVGQPRDGNPKASFGVLDTESWEYSNVRVSYDIEKAAAAVTQAGLPDYLGHRLFMGV